MKSLKSLNTYNINNNLFIRLLFYTLISNTALALIITAIHLFFDHQNNLAKLKPSIAQVESSFLQPLATSLWNFDKEQINVQSNGIMRLPYIQYIKVNEIVGHNEVAISHLGVAAEQYDISKKLDLIHQGQIVGTLFVGASLDQVYENLLKSSPMLFLKQLLIILSVSGCLLFITYFMVIRHINKIALYTRNIRLSSPNEELVLDGRGAREHSRGDELDELVYILDKMQKRIVAELTDKKIAINELQQERDFSATIINSSSTVICCLDAQFKIATINPAAVILTGYSQDELNQKSWLDIFVLNERKAELQHKLAANESLHSIEIDMHDQMGEVNTLLWTFSAFYEDMDIKYLIGFGHDITSQKQTEQEILLLNDQLEEKVNTRTAALTASNKQMGETVKQLKLAQQTLVESEKMASLGSLVTGVAHEINTPIGISVTAAAYLQEEITTFKNRLDKDQLAATDLQHMMTQLGDSSRLLSSNLKRAAELINSFKQVAVDQSSEACYSFNVCENVEQVVSSLMHKIKKSNAHVKITCAKELSIYSFPGSFIQIYSNLIINSINHGFSEWPGERDISIHIERQGNLLIIDYQDTGKGIPEELTENIFSPFVSPAKGGNGSGLGMHIIYNIVSQLFKGKIAYLSESNGAHFRIEIPYRACMNS